MGEVVYLRATIIQVGRVASGLFTMVAVDDNLLPAPVPSWKPVPESELGKWHQVEKRRKEA
jgi:acyl-CoA hydrolase